jgi:hypothetical protein
MVGPHARHFGACGCESGREGPETNEYEAAKHLKRKFVRVTRLPREPLEYSRGSTFTRSCKLLYTKLQHTMLHFEEVTTVFAV